MHAALRGIEVENERTADRLWRGMLRQCKQRWQRDKCPEAQIEDRSQPATKYFHCSPFLGCRNQPPAEPRAGFRKKRRTCFLCMYREHARKQIRILGQTMQNALPQRRILIEQQQEPRHRHWPSGQPAVHLLVLLQTSRFECLGKCQGLTETQTQAFPGDRVYAPRSISNKSCIPTINPLECAHGGDCAALDTTEFRIS